MMLDCVRVVLLHIWRDERRDRVWPCWFSRLTSSSTAVTFSSVRSCFGLPLLYLWSVLHVIRIFFGKVSSRSLLQFIFENSACIVRKRYSLNWYKFLISALSSLLNGRSHYRHFITALKIIAYNNIACICL